MTLNDWLADRYTPTDVLALGAVGSAVVVGTLALAQDIELVPGAEAIGVLVTGGLFLVAFGGAIYYVNQKNREAFYGTPLSVEFDHRNGQVILDGEVAIKIRLYPDGVPGELVDNYSCENVGNGAEGWYSGDDTDPYLEVALEEAA